MTRADRRLALRLALTVAGSLGFLVLVATLANWLHPPSGLERACVSKPLAELGECLQEHQ